MWEKEKLSNLNPMKRSRTRGTLLVKPDVRDLFCHLRPWWYLGPCCCQGTCLYPQSYCCLDLCWCLFPMLSLKAMQMTVVVSTAWRHVNVWNEGALLLIWHIISGTLDSGDLTPPVALLVWRCWNRCMGQVELAGWPIQITPRPRSMALNCPTPTPASSMNWWS